MGAERLFQIVYLLMNHKSMTAVELAERFEVSVRTIYRDINRLSEAGIPLYTTPGMNGGVAMLDSYVLDRSLLTEEEQKKILLGVQNLAMEDEGKEELLIKLRAMFHQADSDWMEVNLTRWGTETEDQSKFQILKHAVIQHQVLQFTYLNAKGEENGRKVKPVKLIFKARDWYLRAFCMMRNEFRTFKLNRMLHIKENGEYFEPIVDYAENTESKDMSDCVPIILRFQKEEAYRIYDVFSVDAVHTVRQGEEEVLEAQVNFPLDEWLYSYLLSYGDKVEIIEPEELRKTVIERAQKMIEKYSQP